MALYRFAVDGKAPPAFAGADLERRVRRAARDGGFGCNLRPTRAQATRAAPRLRSVRARRGRTARAARRSPSRRPRRRTRRCGRPSPGSPPSTRSGGCSRPSHRTAHELVVAPRERQVHRLLDRRRVAPDALAVLVRALDLVPVHVGRDERARSTRRRAARRSAASPSRRRRRSRAGARSCTGFGSQRASCELVELALRSRRRPR